MNRLGQSPGVLPTACAFAVAAVVGSFAVALTVLPAPDEAKASAHAKAKIGPGYATMRPIDLGKPDKPVYTVHAVPRSAAKVRVAATAVTQPSASIAALPLSVKFAPLVIAAGYPSTGAHDIHRIY
jgi:hypothetical protein